jgi:signal transduction histidine kinase
MAIAGDDIRLRGPKHAGFNHLIYRTGKQLLRFRWYLILGAGLFIFLFEAFELFESPSISPLSNTHIRIELLLYLVFIILAALLAEVYVRLMKMHSQALKLLQFKLALSRDLTMTKDWDEVCEHICQNLGQLGHFDEVLLFTYESEAAAYRAAASWEKGRGESNLLENLSQTLIEGCLRQEADLGHAPEPEASHSKIRSLDSDGAYCFSIHDQLTPVARVYFRLPPGDRLTAETSYLLENIEDEIAIALTTTRLRQEHAEVQVTQAVAELQQTISQDLHDTIGQNLGYMRMKLDQFSQPDAQDHYAAVKPELERMRDLANDSYELVRGLLVAMSPEPSMRLGSLIEYHARLVSDRTGLDIQIFHRGRPRRLDPTFVHHIYFIFREALSNVERHAQANNIIVNVDWDPEELHIQIADDGIGFDPALQPALGQYGLTIMRERVRALGGRLELLSSADEGACVSIWLPLVILSASAREINTTTTQRMDTP